MWLGHGSCPWKRPPDQRGGGDLAPEPGFEPGTVALTARCSTVELLRNARRRPVYPPTSAAKSLTVRHYRTFRLGRALGRDPAGRFISDLQARPLTDASPSPANSRSAREPVGRRTLRPAPLPD